MGVPEDKLEKQIQTEVIKWLRNQPGVIVWKQNSGLVRSKGSYIWSGFPGISDLIGMYKGRFMGIEVKRPNKQPSPAQEAFIEMVKAEGGFAGCVHSVEEVKLLYESWQKNS